MLLCVQCGKEFKPICSANCYCSNACRKLAREAQYREHTKSIGYHHKAKYNSKKREVLITDEEQKKIDQEVFLKSAVTFEPAKVYRPGDPEFEQIARNVTPIEQIPTKKFFYRGISND